MTERENIVLVTVDSLRSDCCGFSGGNDGNTPAMDRLAEDGLVFENAIAPGPATLDSIPVIFSGDFHPRSEFGTSVVDNRAQIREHLRARETIPERLSARGYETAAFTTNPWTSRQFGFDGGFDHFEDFMEVEREDGPVDRTLERLGVANDGSPAVDALELVSNWRDGMNMFQSWETFYDDVLDWTERAEEPYFLWIFLVDAHMPFLPAAEYRSRSQLLTYAANLWLYLGNERFESVFREPLMTAYGDTVRYVDACVDRLTRDLADDDPTFVVHGDHGEEFGEHGVYGHGPHLSEEMISTPLLVGNGPSGRIERPFSLADLPNLLERLADDEPVTDLPRPVVRSRNNDPKTVARGRNWRYTVTESDETFSRIDGDRDRPECEAEIEGIARDYVALWEADERERGEVRAAARRIADRGSL